MTPQQYERASAIFHAALDLDAPLRAALIERESAGDAEVRAEVESLLAARERAASFLEPGPVSEPEASLRGRTIGNYEILRELGVGGMGVVYEAEQREPRRRVALKVVRATALGGRAVARFRHEAEILGRLSHPAIARVYEAGTHADGSGPIAYFTMELVEDGASLTDYATVKELVLRARLELFLRVCEGVAYAHQQGVMHRDLKPSNILVDARGHPKLLDFGLAKLTEAENGCPNLETRTGQLLGTVAYMSPEQVAGRPDEVDVRSDVYALGVLFYELLTGRLPHETTHASLPEAVRAIREDEPATLRSIDPALRGDLETIAATALVKDKARRYPTVRALAEDVTRFLERQPILARPPSRMYHLQRLVERNRTVVGASMVTLLALAAGLITSWALFLRSRESERVASQSTDAVLRLSATQRLDDLVARGERLWPPRPDLTERYEGWLADAELLLGGRPVLRAKLAELRAKALPQEAGERAAELSFRDSQDTLWHRQLAKLLEDLELFADEKTGLCSAGISERHGWGVKKRLEFARTIEARSVSAPEAAARWNEACSSIRDPAACPRYAGLVLAPQIGLLPLGQDPASRLWEFADLATGAPAVRGADGALSFDQETGLVLVLLPGGTFWMGRQQTDPGQANYERASSPQERPVHEVTLSPFFLSKYEMSQAQWLRCTGVNPSQYGSDRGGSLINPVEQVSWTACRATLARLGLGLPSEAQWEYAARAGTSGPWWTGDDEGSLLGAANLIDLAPPRDDGYAASAPVNTFRPSPFGLHHVHGNVWEWCMDVYDDTFYGKSPARDPVAQAGGTMGRVHRGGGFDDVSTNALSALRHADSPDFARWTLGVRPARALEGAGAPGR